MNIIKRLAVKAIFSKEQRAVIAQSIAYSEHKYRQHGDVDGAIKVGIVRKAVEKAFVVKNNRKYSAKEVAMIVERHVDAAIRATIDMFAEKKRQAEANKDCSTGTLAVGTVVTREKCDACEHKDECGIYDALFKEKEASEAPDCGNENCEKRETCDRQYDNCPSYIAPTPEGGEEEAPEGDCDTVGTASAAEKIAEEEPKAE
jgi:hypothetical protein